METTATLSSSKLGGLIALPISHSPLQTIRRRIRTPRIRATRTAVLRSSPSSLPPVGELLEEDILLAFLKEREVNGDFISRASDIIWKKNVKKISNADADSMLDISQEPEEIMGSESGGGFLKLTKTQEWLLGDSSAPSNKKATTRAVQDDSEWRRRLNLLNYEALKRELLLLSVGIGTACSGYCLLAFSVQAAVSYAVGVLFSCLYLQLLYKHADNISKEMVPQIFRQKKAKRIGVRSEDLRDSFYKFVKGSSMALSSPRLVIPAAIYGIWALSHQHETSDFFDFQLVPAMLGMFVYKAAALVQVYRDNEDLEFVFPEEREN
ncbi:hypothetical protein RJ641_008259 [Dillenia turbinata]|uniref:Uncharacterized protein n=1 Tax=Dillenia turbinata TaxID=194707 RepID=A0AAN8V318_9MAGN